MEMIKSAAYNQMNFSSYLAPENALTSKIISHLFEGAVRIRILLQVLAERI